MKSVSMKSKKAKPLWRITVLTTVEAEDAVCELLASVSGLPTATYFDLERQTSQASVFAEQGDFSPEQIRKEIVSGLDRIRDCGLNIGNSEIEIARVKREDWAESWKRHFKPIEIKAAAKKPRLKAGSRPLSLLVKPSWSKKPAAKHQVVVVLDPGLSFGTGQHPTTSFCLHEIVAHRQSGAAQSFLDIGTGSGILAIAAAKLGYTPVQAFDFDPECVRISRENARKNRVEMRLKPVRGDITKLPARPARQFDLVCANLISNLLISERRRIVNRVKKDGKLVLAGILAAEFSEVEQAFAEVGLRLCSSRVENEWRSGAFCFH
jgi:ribosomal protein L11 methyltransferase